MSRIDELEKKLKNPKTRANALKELVEIGLDKKNDDGVRNYAVKAIYIYTRNNPEKLKSVSELIMEKYMEWKGRQTDPKEILKRKDEIQNVLKEIVGAMNKVDAKPNGLKKPVKVPLRRGNLRSLQRVIV